MQKLYGQAGVGWSALTAREREVIYPVAQGKPNKLIAMELGISTRTVEAHRARIFHKMGVKNAVELARAVYAPTRRSSPFEGELSAASPSPDS